MTDAKPPADTTPKEKKAKKAPATAPVSLVMASSPHVRTRESIESVMGSVVIALAPALIGAVILFGLDALRVMLWSVAGCLVFEAGCLWIGGRKDVGRTLRDGTAALTGLLLAMNLPSSAPWWLVLLGALVAMVLGKHVFGGLGANPFNPALVARVFLLIAYPARMTHWPVPRFFRGELAADATTAATPLGVLKTDGLAAAADQFPALDLFLGNVGGSLGETSALLLLIGGLFLIVRGVIRWHVPVAYIATMALLSAIAWAIKPDAVADPLFHLCAGGLFLGAFFMATDYVTSPLSAKGMIVFGVGCGVLTFVIRFFGSFPEGVSFAIVIMNSLAALIDRYFVPRREGLKTKAAEE